MTVENITGPAVASPAAPSTTPNPAETISIDEIPSQAVEATPPARVIVREILETALLTLFIFWMVNSVTGRFRIQGQSMEPTMHEGQHVIINKLTYLFDGPERGDIIVMQFPRDRSRDFIKRIIGLPGDTIEIANSQVKVNGALLNEPYIQAPPSYTDTWVVPEDEFFVLGDNRNNSHDSHTWGFLPRSDLIGKAWVVYWPPPQWESVPHVAHPEVPEALASGS